ncbi:hypothetical protein Q5P01_006012 [Channa striata]|uniref:Clr5 domain-containing protein n=1 Tax=Channa striata TaxID=64152 RepID=A0AA88SVP3_CHASR|nr:hypothetical protein Q5P01_006012 [Channa striata]
MEGTFTEWEPFIELYFELGLKYKDIKSVLSSKHNFHISERHLKRILRARGYSRHKAYFDLADMVDFIRNQLQNSGQLHGYRWMYVKCRKHRLRVRKDDVSLVLKELDPRGVSLRQARRLRRRNYFSKGPNFIWHLDSYDKLKPYGICVNGCIDGFSRKIIWLNAYTTNSDPKLFGGYYMESVQRLGGCPRVVRGDLRNREWLCQRLSAFSPYLEGASTANQRIEYWWGFLRRQCVQFWLALLGNLRENGLFDGGLLDKSLLQFCCLGLIQESLECTPHQAFKKPQRPQWLSQCDVMYSLPELYRTRDFLSPVEDEHVKLCKSECVFRLSVPCDPDVYELCNVIMAESHLSLPNDPYQAVNLYMSLREAIRAVL